MLKAAEVSLGQGWLFGRAGPLPEFAPGRAEPAPRRRAGAKEQWG